MQNYSKGEDFSMNTNDVAVQGTGFLDTFKQKVNFDDLVVKVQESRGMLMDIALYGGIGLLSGYLIKRYSSVVIMLVFVIAGLAVLQQFDFLVIAINWPKINELLGLQPTVVIMSDNMPMIAWEWAKSNTTIVVSGIVGFLIGLKIG